MSLNKHSVFKHISIKQFQPIFKLLHKISLVGMNYGAAAYELKYSGEYRFLNDVSKIIKKECVIFDVGAHKGNYATHLISKFPFAKSIYSFEPTRMSFEVLKKASSVSHFHPINSAVGENNRPIKLGYNRHGSVLASHFYSEDMEVEQVDCTTIDEFCKIEKIITIDFLKIDVEGFELNVLHGAKEMLNGRNIKVIQFEFGNHQLRARHFLKDFVDVLSDYQIYRIVQNGIYPISYCDIDEVFQVTNYVAIQKSIH